MGKWDIYDKDFWSNIDQLVKQCDVVIDRPKDTAHPRFPDLIYPVDYGYLKGTTSMDDDGIDVWKGTEIDKGVNAIICTIDLTKKDSEIKLLLGCTEQEIEQIYKLHNQTDSMKGLLIRR